MLACHLALFREIHLSTLVLDKHNFDLLVALNKVVQQNHSDSFSRDHQYLQQIAPQFVKQLLRYFTQKAVF